MVLLQYLVKFITHYYCTVNNMFHAVPNDQQTLFQFIDILNTQLVDMLLMIPQIVYATRLRSGLSDLVIWSYELWCCLHQKPDSVTDFVCETAVLLKDKELSQQLTSGTRICELACMLNENSLSKLYYDVNNWLKFERAWNFNMVISARAAWITFKHMRFKNQLRFWKVIARISQRTFFLRHSV